MRIRASRIEELLRMARRGATAVFVAAFVLAGACSDDGGGPAPLPTTGRGTPACQVWQNSLCRWADKCSGINATCEQIRGLSCKSDGEAQRCATGMDAATCGQAPPSCDVVDIVDTAPGVAACKEYIAAYCGHQDACKPGTRMACLQQQQLIMDCSQHIGMTMDYETCLADVRATPCSAPSFPASCKGVLLKW